MKAYKKCNKSQRVNLIQQRGEKAKSGFVDNRLQLTNQANTIDAIQTKDNKKYLLTDSMGAGIDIRNSPISSKTIQRTITNEDGTECVLDKFNRISECVQSVTSHFYENAYRNNKYKIMPHYDDIFDVFNKEHDLIFKCVIDNMTLPEITDLIYDKTKSAIDVLAIIEEDGIISSKLKENGFNELNYKGLRGTLGSLCFELLNSDNEEVVKILRHLSSVDGFGAVKKIFENKNEANCYDYELIGKACGEIADKDEQEIRGIIPAYIIGELESYITAGNCGEIANFIYGEKLTGDYKEGGDEGYFNRFLATIDDDVPKDKVRLIRANSNIGHDFTLAEYKISPDSETLVEIIQAWEGKYSVKDWFAKNSSVLTKTELITHLNILHNGVSPGYESSLNRLFNAAVGNSNEKKQAIISEKQAFNINLFISKDENKSPHDFALSLLERPALY